MLRLTRRNRSSTPIVPHTSSLRLRCFAADSGVNFSDATFISWAWSKHQNFPKFEPFVGISMGRYGEPFLWFPIWIPKWRSWWVKHETKRCGLHQQKVSSTRFNQPTLVEGTNIVCSSLMKSYEYTSQSLMDRYGVKLLEALSGTKNNFSTSENSVHLRSTETWLLKVLRRSTNISTNISTNDPTQALSA